MFRSDDGDGSRKANADSAKVVGGALDGVAGIFALGAIIGSSGGDYVRDLHASIARLFGGGGLEAALREEQARDKATVLALAVIADGAITEAERPAIAAFAERHGIDAGEVIAKVASLAEQLRDPAVLREKVARCAANLDSDERLEVFVAVKNLAHRGSRAWPEEGGYRGAAGPTPEALVAIFRDALGITAAGGV
jgi:uncharacterized membrane protein YebE (DUF533 family)